MTDQKLIAGIFNDFLGLYTGKIQTGIRPLIEKYKNHPMLMGLLSNLDEAAKIQAPKAMKEIYSFYKEYRGRDLEDADWCIRPLSAAIRAAFSGQTGPY